MTDDRLVVLNKDGNTASVIDPDAYIDAVEAETWTRSSP